MFSCGRLHMDTAVLADEESLWGVITNELDCGFEGSEFELRPHFYVHFRTNNLERCMNLLMPLPNSAVG